MRKAASRQYRRAVEAAASLTGKRFNLLVASSLVATAAIVAAAATSSSDSGPLAALLGRSLAADTTPIASTRARAPEAVAGPAGSSARSRPGPGRRFARRLAGTAARTGAGAGTRARTGTGSRTARPRPEAPAPEAGQIKHVFVVSLASSGYDAAFGSDAADALPGGHAAAPGRPAQRLLAARPSAAAELDRRRQRPAADAPDDQEPTAPTTAALRLPGRNPDPGRPARPRPVHLARLHGGHGRPETGQPDNCVYPATRRRRRRPLLGGYSVAAQPVRLLPLAARPRRLRRPTTCR